MDFSNCLAEGEGIEGPSWDGDLRAKHTSPGVWRWWLGWWNLKGRSLTLEVLW